ncbi:hypothetical protein BDR07DRAFT_1540853, partial [Suillus spraguei]
EPNVRADVYATLDIAKQWCWDGDQAVKLVENLKQYYQCKGPFAGGQANGKDCWENLPISAKSYPLKHLQSLYSQLSLMRQMSNDIFRSWCNPGCQTLQLDSLHFQDTQKTS